MIHARKSVLAGALAAGLLLALVAPAHAQIAVVTVRSLNALQADFRYLAPLVKAEKEVAALDAFLGLHPRLKALEGVDGTRPCGLYVTWPEKEADVAAF